MTMVDNYPPASAGTDETRSRRLFLIEGLDADDALLRVLGVFAVQQARVQAVAFTVADGRFALRLEAEGLAEQRTRHLRVRLETLPQVASVSMGWRGGLPAPGAGGPDRAPLIAVGPRLAASG